MTKLFRYPGARPFLEEDWNLFYGRDDDKENLVGLIELEPIVVLFGKSGYGKSSLLNAAVIPHLRLRLTDRHEVFTIRLIEPADGQDKRRSPIEVLSSVLSVNETDRDFMGAKLNIPSLLPDDHTAQLWYKLKSLQLQSKVTSAITLVFDQFEELNQFNQSEIEELGHTLKTLLNYRVPKTVMKLITEKLEDDPGYFSEAERHDLFRKINLKLVFSLHSDRLNVLEKLKDDLPAIFKYTYELKALNKEQALESLQKPAALEGDYASPAFTYSEEASAFIIEKLTEGDQPIETFQLQLLAQHAEEQIIAKKKRSERMEALQTKKGDPAEQVYVIGIKDLDDPKKIYKKHYDRSIATLAWSKREGARNLIQKGLIIDGNRVPLPEALITKQHRVSFESLEKLQEKSLLRSQRNSVGRRSWELSHDTLIEAIQDSIEERKKRWLWIIIILLLLIIALLSAWLYHEKTKSDEGNGIIINPLVTATIDPVSGPRNAEFTFTYRITDSLSDIKVEKVRWDFGDDNLSPEDSVKYEYRTYTHSYGEVKKYEVKLLVYTSDGQVREEERMIEVTEDQLVNDVSITAVPEGGSAPVSVQFSVSDSITAPAGEYKWMVNDSLFATSPNPRIEFRDEGEYRVRVNVFNNDIMIARGFREISITPPSGRLEILANPQGGPAPLTIAFSLSNPTPDMEGNYEWTVNDSIFSTQAKPIYDFKDEGGYTIGLSIKNNEEITINPKEIRIGAPVENIEESDFPIAIALPDSTGLAPFKVQLRGDMSEPRDAGLVYFWDIEDNISSDLVNPTHTFKDPGSYEVVLTVRDTLERESRDTVYITVDPDRPPIAKAVATFLNEKRNFSKDTTIRINGVAPFTVQFDASKSEDDVNILQYKWDFGDGIDADGEQVGHTFIEEKAHTVVLTVSDARGQTSQATARVIVSFKPVDPIADYQSWMSEFKGIQKNILDKIKEENKSWRDHIIPTDSLNLVGVYYNQATRKESLPDMLFFFTTKEGGRLYKFRNEIDTDIQAFRSERLNYQSLIETIKDNLLKTNPDDLNYSKRKFLKPNGEVAKFGSEGYEDLTKIFENNLPSRKTINFYYTIIPYDSLSGKKRQELNESYQLLGQPR